MFQLREALSIYQFTTVAITAKAIDQNLSVKCGLRVVMPNVLDAIRIIKWGIVMH